MARAHKEFNSLRLGRRESERVMVALLCSALVHLLIWGGYHTGDKMGWWQKWHLPLWPHSAPKHYALKAQIAEENDPMIFVDVSHADADAPTKATYYSSKNSHAANPDPANANIPKINGHQTDVPKTEDVTRPLPKSNPDASDPKSPESPNRAQTPKVEPDMPPPSPMPLAPSPTSAQPAKPGETEMRPSAATAPPLKPLASSAESPTQPSRPRTLKEAQSQLEQTPGQQMKQDGGVARHALWSSLDAKATPFGDYDAAIIEAVSQRWYDLLDNHRYAQDRSGKVTLRFKLKPDGTIIEMQTAENTVGELLGYLCQEAIEEAAPFAKWPPDMLRMIGANYRDITFTFYYY